MWKPGLKGSMRWHGLAKQGRTLREITWQTTARQADDG